MGPLRTVLTSRQCSDSVLQGGSCGDGVNGAVDGQMGHICSETRHRPAVRKPWPGWCQRAPIEEIPSARRSTSQAHRDRMSNTISPLFFNFGATKCAVVAVEDSIMAAPGGR